MAIDRKKFFPPDLFPPGLFGRRTDKSKKAGLSTDATSSQAAAPKKASGRFGKLKIFDIDQREKTRDSAQKVTKCALVAFTIFGAIAVVAVAATIALTATVLCVAAIPTGVLAVPALLGLVGTGALVVAGTAAAVGLASGIVWGSAHMFVERNKTDNGNNGYAHV